MTSRATAANPIASAASAGLRYVSNDRPGYRREMGPLGFRYRRADGRLVTSPSELKRIRALAIPPAWKDVWICPDPGQELFQYVNGDGVRRDINSSDVNAYLKEISGADFTAKDFRTWNATVLATRALRDFDAADTAAQAKKNVMRAIEAVAGVLGNTPAVCRKSYIHPAVVECCMDRSMPRKLTRVLPASLKKAASKLRADEVAALRLLACAKSQTARRAA